MYKRNEVIRDITDWNKKETDKTKRVRISVIMEMLSAEEQTEIEKEIDCLVEKIKKMVPDHPPTPDEETYSC